MLGNCQYGRLLLLEKCHGRNFGEFGESHLLSLQFKNGYFYQTIFPKTDNHSIFLENGNSAKLTCTIKSGGRCVCKSKVKYVEARQVIDRDSSLLFCVIKQIPQIPSMEFYPLRDLIVSCCLPPLALPCQRLPSFVHGKLSFVLSASFVILHIVSENISRSSIKLLY